MINSNTNKAREKLERDIGSISKGASGATQDKDDDENLFNRWYFIKLQHVHVFIFGCSLGVYVLSLPKTDTDFGAVRWNVLLDCTVFVLFIVCVAAFLMVRQIPERWRSRALLATLLPFPVTCLMYIVVFQHAPPELTRKRLMHIYWGGWEQPLHVMPAIVAMGFVGLGFKSTLSSRILFRPGRQSTVPVCYAGCTVLSLGHCYYLTRDRAALELLALSLISLFLGCHIGWRIQALTRKLFISRLHSKRESKRSRERLQHEMRAREANHIEFVSLQDENTRLREQTGKAAVMVNQQVRKRLKAESRLGRSRG